MARALSVGDEAPNFDLTSTEDVLLMLRDECVRTSLILYFFQGTEGDGVRDDLLALARRWDELTAVDARVFGVSRAELPQLKDLQKELHLPFPLLTDDRGFSAVYGLTDPVEGEASTPVLAVVDRYQKLRSLAAVEGGVEEAMPEALRSLKAMPSPTASLPKKVVNWWVDRWVN
jgi:peroxiredoxin